MSTKPSFLAPRIPIVRLALWLPALAVYVTAFWGNFHGQFWPEALRGYAGWAVRWAWTWYQGHVSITGSRLVHHRLVWLAVSLVLGGLVPLVVARLAGRRWRDVGLGWPNRWGRRMVGLCLAIILPAAWFIAGERADMAGVLSPVYVLVMLGVSLPEHILLTGMAVAVLLPGGRLPKPGPLAPVEGGALRRTLRWLGLAQPAEPGVGLGGRILAWLGLDGPALAAIAGAGLLFGLIHAGAGPIEFMTSFPGGMALAYVTYRSGSIWPGWLIHVMQMALVAVFISWRG